MSKAPAPHLGNAWKLPQATDALAIGSGIFSQQSLEGEAQSESAAGASVKGKGKSGKGARPTFATSLSAAHNISFGGLALPPDAGVGDVLAAAVQAVEKLAPPENEIDYKHKGLTFDERRRELLAALRGINHWEVHRAKKQKDRDLWHLTWSYAPSMGPDLHRLWSCVTRLQPTLGTKIIIRAPTDWQQLSKERTTDWVKSSQQMTEIKSDTSEIKSMITKFMEKK